LFLGKDQKAKVEAANDEMKDQLSQPQKLQLLTEKEH
jgi:hypothetical protein